MDVFLNRNSKLGITLLWVVLLAFFTDGVNVTDLFTSVTTVHFDECDESQFAGQASPALNENQSSASRPTNEAGNISSRPSVPIKHVILDQDSPSLAAVTLHTSEYFASSSKEAATSYRFLLASDLLYLHNCTLLL